MEEKTMWWICESCGGQVDLKQQLIENGNFDVHTGKAKFNPDMVPIIEIRCPHCGAKWFFEISTSLL